MNAKNPLDETPDIEEILAQHYGAPTPSADFAARLRAQLRARAQSGAARRAAFFFTGFARAALGVTLALDEIYEDVTFEQPDHD